MYLTCGISIIVVWRLYSSLTTVKVLTFVLILHTLLLCNLSVISRNDVTLTVDSLQCYFFCTSYLHTFGIIYFNNRQKRLYSSVEFIYNVTLSTDRIVILPFRK